MINGFEDVTEKVDSATKSLSVIGKLLVLNTALLGVVLFMQVFGV